MHIVSAWSGTILNLYAWSLIISVNFQGDPDYLKYWNHIQLEGRYEEHVLADITAAFNEIRKSQTILFIDESILKGEFIENPESFPDIKLFGGGKPFYGCFLFTKNSPLLPMFRHASTQLIESGQYLRIDSKWKGSKIPEAGAVEKLILTVGQTFLVFVFFLFFLGITLILLGMECCHNFYKKYTRPVLTLKRPALQRQNFLKSLRH